MVTNQVAAATGTGRAQGMTGGALAVLLTATFIGAFDVFVVNVAAPSLQRDLHASDALLQLVVGGYAFAYAAGLITGGRLGDVFGHRRMYVAGMVAFTVSSLACGLARSPVELVAARLAEGLSAAAMLPQVLALITATLAGLGWRLIFLINLPIGAVTAVLAARWLPDPATRRGRANLDLPGALGVACTLALALLPLTVGADEGWPPWTWAALGAAVPAGAVTLWWQRRLGRAENGHRGQPVLDLSLFRHWTFRAGLAANACFLAYFGSFMFALTLFLQDGLRLDALQAGLAFAPAGVMFSAAALAGSRVLHRYGPRAVVAGSLITVAALALLLVLAHAGANRANLPWIILVAAVASLGNGIVLPALIGTSLVKVAPHQAGAGAGLLTTAQQFASSAGVAVIGTVFFVIAGRSHSSPGGFAAGMTAAAGACLALLTAVTVLTALIARTTRRDEAPRRQDARRTRS